MKDIRQITRLAARLLTIALAFIMTSTLSVGWEAHLGVGETSPITLAKPDTASQTQLSQAYGQLPLSGYHQH